MDGLRGGTALEPAPTLPAPTLPGQALPVDALPVPTLPAPARSRKGAPRAVPERSPAHAHLGLDDLRGYRKALAEEESKVSYWRRILQARLDGVRAEIDGGSPRELDTGALRPVLTESRVRAGRKALVQITQSDDIPPLPRLDELWERRTAPGDGAGLDALEADLAVAERQLSDYRAALHRRIADATGELIARYREQPSLCLSALPLPPGRGAGV